MMCRFSTGLAWSQKQHCSSVRWGSVVVATRQRTTSIQYAGARALQCVWLVVACMCCVATTAWHCRSRPPVNHAHDETMRPSSSYNCCCCGGYAMARWFKRK
eukprot:scaffold149968_cov33-Tisochrysis_lutea.AAC.1